MIFGRIKEWWGRRQCRKGRHLWVWNAEIKGKAKIGDVYKTCSRCGREAKLTTNFSAVAFNYKSTRVVEICEVMSEDNEILEDIPWEKVG